MNLVLIFIGMVIGAFLGIQIASLVTELRHDCMPHDPNRCREARNNDTELVH